MMLKKKISERASLKVCVAAAITLIATTEFALVSFASGPAPLPALKSPKSPTSTTSSNASGGEAAQGTEGAEAAEAAARGISVEAGRIQAGSTGFSIMPPADWTIRSDIPGQTLVLESPVTKKNHYRSTIQVRVAQGPRYMDSVGISDFKDEMTTKLGQEGGSMQDFSIRNAESVKTDDGREGLLVYSGFTMNTVEMLQAHLLLSSAQQHVVVTYTDLAKNFDSNAGDAPLGIAWGAMTTAKMPGENPERFAGPIQIAALAGVLIVVIGVLLTVRNALAKQAYARAASETPENFDTGETTDSSQIINLSNSARPNMSLFPVSEENLLDSTTPQSIRPRRAA